MLRVCVQSKSPPRLIAHARVGSVTTQVSLTPALPDVSLEGRLMRAMADAVARTVDHVDSRMALFEQRVLASLAARPTALVPPSSPPPPSG